MTPIYCTTSRLTIADQVHQGLLDAIKVGELTAGQRLHDHSWATRWSVSRTPVREAFQRLEWEGLVEAEPARYTKLVDFTPETAEQQAREWATVHASLADVLAATRKTLLLARLRHAHECYLRASVGERDGAAFEFFSVLRHATPNFGLRIGASLVAYRFRLATSRLPERPRAEEALQTDVITALLHSDPDAFRLAFDRWLAARIQLVVIV